MSSHGKAETMSIYWEVMKLPTLTSILSRMTKFRSEFAADDDDAANFYCYSKFVVERSC